MTQILERAGHGQRERGVFGRLRRAVALIGEAADVAAGAEGATRAAQHHATHGVIGLEFAHDATEFAIHVQREGIALLRAVHQYRGDPVAIVGQVDAHRAASPSRRSSVPCSTTRPSSSSVASVTMVS